MSGRSVLDVTGQERRKSRQLGERYEGQSICVESWRGMADGVLDLIKLSQVVQLLIEDGWDSVLIETPSGGFIRL